MSGERLGSIEGTMTFRQVNVYRENEMIRVSGTYDDAGSPTILEAPPDSVYIEGMQLIVGDEEAITLTAPEDGWVMVEATESELLITDSENE